jgi:hypothetical protein
MVETPLNASGRQIHSGISARRRLALAGEVRVPMERLDDVSVENLRARFFLDPTVWALALAQVGDNVVKNASKQATSG